MDVGLRKADWEKFEDANPYASQAAALVKVANDAATLVGEATVVLQEAQVLATLALAYTQWTGGHR